MSINYSGDYITFPDGTKQASAGVGMKNRIINGSMTIDQRNAGAAITPTNGQFSLDRWLCGLTQASKYTIGQYSNAPTGFSNSIGISSNSSYSVVSGDAFYISQAIEGFNTADLNWGTANAKTVTLSFQVYSSLTGTFGGALQNGAQNRSYPFSFTVSSANTWTAVSITIAGDTSGTWLTTNGAGIRLFFNLGAGSTYLGTVNTWAGSAYFGATGNTSVVGTSGAAFYITGVQLEVGSSATSFDYRQYGQELALCQRYCYVLARSTGYYFATMFNYDTGQAIAIIPFPVTMRTAPSLSATSGTGYYQFYRNGTADAFNSFSIVGPGVTAAGIQNYTEISGTAGQAGGVYADQSGVLVYFSAEL